LLQTFRDPNPDVGDSFARAVAFVGEDVLVQDLGDGFLAHLYDGTTGELLRSFVDPLREEPLWEGVLPLASEGDRVLIGDPYDGAAYLFDSSTGELIQTFSQPGLGTSVAFLGDDVLVAAYDGVYRYDSATGEQLRSYARPGERSLFGTSLATTDRHILVGAPGTSIVPDGMAYLFDAATGEIIHTFTDPEGGCHVRFGYSVAFLGDDVLIGSPAHGDEAGHVHWFDAATGDLVARFQSPSSEPYEPCGFGGSLAADGDHFLAGASWLTSCGPDEVHLFTTSTSTVTDTATATMDAEGNYSFERLSAGEYVVRVIVPEGYALTSPGGDGTYTIVVGSGGTPTVIDFGVVNDNPTPPPEPEPVPEPTPEPVPEPTPEPVPEPDPVPEPSPDPTPEPEPAPVPDPDPIPEPIPEPVPDLDPPSEPDPRPPLDPPREPEPPRASDPLPDRDSPAASDVPPSVILAAVQYPPPDLWGPLIPVEWTRFQRAVSSRTLDTGMAADLVAEPPLFERDVVGWQLVQGATPAPMVVRRVPDTERSDWETVLSQKERDRPDRSVPLPGGSARVRVRGVSTPASAIEPESDRARRFDVALRDWEPEPIWPPEVEADSGVCDFSAEPDCHERSVWETEPE